MICLLTVKPTFAWCDQRMPISFQIHFVHHRPLINTIQIQSLDSRNSIVMQTSGAVNII